MNSQSEERSLDKPEQVKDQQQAQPAEEERQAEKLVILRSSI